MLSRELPRLDPLTGLPPGRRLAASALRAGSRILGRLAHRLARRGRTRADPVYEFYADAGAPEGALYIDGHLVGHLDGVRRL